MSLATLLSLKSTYLKSFTKKRFDNGDFAYSCLGLLAREPLFFRDGTDDLLVKPPSLLDLGHLQTTTIERAHCQPMLDTGNSCRLEFTT